MLATALGLPDEDVFLIRRAAPLHDVGKIGIPDSVLRKPGPLTEAEWVTMKQHTTIGARILSGGRSRVVRLAELIALSHHEHWNGGGYPRGLAGEAIPLVGRIAMVADVFDALSSERVYRGAWGVIQVLNFIRDHAGRRFDPRIAELCEQPAVRASLLALRARGADARTAPALEGHRPHRVVTPMPGVGQSRRSVTTTARVRIGADDIGMPHDVLGRPAADEAPGLELPRMAAHRSARRW